MRRLAPLLIVALAAAACSPTVSGEAGAVAGAGTSTTTAEEPAEPATTSTTSTAATSTTAAKPTHTVRGFVVTSDGARLADATFTAGAVTATTNANGAFELTVPPGEVTVTRPGWVETTFTVSDDKAALEVTMEPFIARAVRVSRYVAEDPAMFEDLLRQIEGTRINALVFDTKDEPGTVLYDTSVDEAHELGAVEVVYDPAAYLAAAHEKGLYTITRLVSFEDPVRVKADPDTKLAGAWVDASNEENWDYLLDLAVEACDLGFDEIQFDYVRFPAGKTGALVNSRGTFTAADRLGAISAFLVRARELLHPMGCAVAADVFGIVMTSSTDEGIGQRPEEISQVVDVISPMLYPSHYSEGTLGYADPNSHPGPVIAWALDAGLPRVEGTATVRPWLQAFYYNGSQVKAEIEEAEEREIGWMLWNAGGEYADSWLPVDE